VKSYQRRARDFNKRHPWLTGALFGLYMAVTELLLFHERFVPAAVTGLAGFVFFGYYMRTKVRPGRITERELVLITAAVALVMIVILAIRSFPR
jgi:hypothetical protein